MRLAVNCVLRKRIGGGVAGAGNPLKANIGELRDQTARLRRVGAQRGRTARFVAKHVFNDDLTVTMNHQLGRRRLS